MSDARDLIDFIGRLTVRSIPPETIAQARSCLLDALGCGFFGADRPWSQILYEEMAAEGANGTATAIARRKKLAPPAAAFCNGISMHGYELDDLIAGSVVHPGASITPAALAAAEAADASGAQLIEAIVAGYEVTHRLGLALGTEPAKKGFHTTSIVAPVACAVAAGVAAGLKGPQLISAVGLACSASSGIKAFAAGHGGGMVKRMHVGRSAEAGVRLAQLAARGFEGPPQAIDGRFGLLQVFGGAGAQPGKLSTGLGESWAIRRTWFKVYPVCGWIQAVIQLLVQMRGDRPLKSADIASIRVGVSRYAQTNNGEPAPSDTMGAQYSIPFCAAVALLGQPHDPAAFAQAQVDDRTLRELARRVEVVVDPEVEAAYPVSFGARVTLALTSGEHMEDMVLDCHGTPADPCGADELRRKFMLLSRGHLSPDRAAKLADRVEALEDLHSVRRMTELLAGEETQAGGPTS